MVRQHQEELPGGDKSAAHEFRRGLLQLLIRAVLYYKPLLKK